MSDYDYWYGVESTSAQIERDAWRDYRNNPEPDFDKPTLADVMDDPPDRADDYPPEWDPEVDGA